MKWSEEDKKYLIHNYGIITSKEIGKVLDRTPIQVRSYANSLGLHSNLHNSTTNKKVTNEEFLLKCNNVGIEPLEEYINNHTKIKFKCPFCGKEFSTAPYNITSGNTGSCGCAIVKIRKKYKYIPIGYFNLTKRRSKRYNLKFNLTYEYVEELLIKQDFKCNLSKLPIAFYYEKYKENTASLDRIDSTKGYIMGNVQWLHKEVNFMKQDSTNEHFIDMCKLIANNN